MIQSRTASLIESATNIAVGLGIALACNALVLPAMGVPIGAAENLTVAGILTIASLARSYLLRRLFVRLGVRMPLTPGLIAVIAERRRQIEVEGWTAAHDDETYAGKLGELARAGGSYALNAGMRAMAPRTDDAAPPASWPWSEHWWKPGDFRRDLVRAGALIAAEIDLFDRMKRGRG